MASGIHLFYAAAPAVCWPGNARKTLPMTLVRSIASCCVTALFLGGCASAPEFRAATTSAEALNAPWPGFLPVEQILASGPVRTGAASNEILSLEARANRLRRRAQLLRQPVLDAYDRLSLLNPSDQTGS